jgi:exodeoxyribonuclease V alpha subunit
LFNQKVKVQKKIFVSQETGFGVFKASISGSRDSKIIVGNLFDVKEGDFLEIEAESIVHPRFGNQLKVLNFKFIQPQDTEGIEKYLITRIKGVGKITAKKIVRAFGLSTLKILEENPEQLSTIKGIRKPIIEEIKKNILENKILRNLTIKLSPYGIGTETIFKIYREFGDRAFEICESNPYCMIDKVKGIGFKIADTIASGFGISKNDPNRVSKGIDFIISQSEQHQGDLFLPDEELTERCSILLNLDSETISKGIENKIGRQELIKENIPEKIVVSAKNYYIEKSIAAFLFKIAEPHEKGDKWEINTVQIQQRLAIQLSKEQKAAINSAIQNSLTIITGGPGTGKTTIIRAIIEAFMEKGKQVLIGAPTGRAAKRIEETSHYPASTIHRMLKVNPETRDFYHNEHNPLLADAIIIDEFSMVDSFLFYSLLRAIPSRTKIIIIGDKDQLPSVGPGNILRDLIKSDYFNTIYLNRNFRQTENSLIIENAYRINTGDALILKPYSENLDFVFIPIKSEQQVIQKVKGIINYFKNQYNPNSSEIQILVPMYRGEAGIDNINKTIQNQFNSETLLIKREKLTFKRLDKVMQLKNNYDKEIFNGEMGIISDFTPQGQKMMVDYDGYLVEYDKDEIDELALAYAISVHKSQGSEYDIVVLILLPSHSIMLNREIFYTAVTRAKKRIFLLSDPATIQKAVFNSSPRQRKTLLPLRLKKVFENQNLDF